ncbi:MAG: PHP domain-containing protein [Prolixibacteraceae bacterium]
MKRFRADLHIHTVLSACANLEMSPGTIVRKAKDNNLDLIAITDHNSTLHCSLVKELAGEEGIAVLFGAEVTTREEVHCLAYFKDKETLDEFQEYLDENLPAIRYNPDKFGFQVLVDKNEKIIRMIKNYLNVAISQSIDQVEQKVHHLGGLFIPAHIERPMFGIFNQLGFIPETLVCDALGIMSHSKEDEIRKKYNLPQDIALIKASDAHHPEMIGKGFTTFEMNDPSFEEIKKALMGIEGRKTFVA